VVLLSKRDAGNAAARTAAREALARFGVVRVDDAIDVIPDVRRRG
jgi:hypothetical protein